MAIFRDFRPGRNSVVPDLEPRAGPGRAREGPSRVLPGVRGVPPRTMMYDRRIGQTFRRAMDEGWYNDSPNLMIYHP